jgi:hypothetical protein
MKRLVTGAALLLALVAPATAQADPGQDQALVDAMADVGITLYAAAIPGAYMVCRAVWSGTDPDYVSHRIAVNNPDWGIDRASYFVAHAIIIYCPPSGMRTLR